MDDDKPIGRRLVLRPKVITPTEERSLPGDGTAISVALIHRENQLAQERAARPAGEGRPAPAPDDDSAIRVRDMLRQNHAAPGGSGPELIAMPVRRRSRRNRDFAVLLAVAIGASGALALVFRDDGRVIALALSGIAFVALILAWILFGVMDNY